MLYSEFYRLYNLFTKDFKSTVHTQITNRLVTHTVGVYTVQVQDMLTSLGDPDPALQDRKKNLK